MISEVKMIILNNKRGSLTIEASIALPIIMTLILVMATLIKIVYLHNQVQYAINESVKEMSTYGYLYSATGIKQLNDSSSSFLEEKKESFSSHYETAIDSLETIKDVLQISNENGADSQQDIPQTINNMKEKVENIEESFYSLQQISQDILNHPEGSKKGIKNEAVSMASLFAFEAMEKSKNWIGSILVKNLMQKYLINDSNSPDKKLKMLGVINGVEGLDFNKTTLFKDGETIDVVVSYNVKPVVPFNIIPKIKITQRALSKAWLDGDGEWPEEEIEIPDTSQKEYIWVKGGLNRQIELIEIFGGNVNSRSSNGAVEKFDIDTGTAWNIVSLDLTATRNNSIEKISRTVTGEIDLIHGYSKQVYSKDDPKKIRYDIKHKKVKIIIPKNTKPVDFDKYFEELKKYAMKNNIDLEYTEYGVVEEIIEGKE